MSRDISDITVEEGIDAARRFSDSAERYEPRHGANGGGDAEAVPAAGHHVGDALVPLRTVSAASWAGKPIPAHRWIVKNRLMRGTVAILSGDGGIGKTTIALQLGIGVVLDLGWLNAVIDEPGPVLFFTSEEDEGEIWRRVAAIAEHHGRNLADLGDLHVFSCLSGDEQDPTLGAPDPRTRTVQATPLLDRLTARALEIAPSLIIIESAADVFAGNEIVRSEVRQFMGLMRRLARKTGAAVLLLQHPSQAGMKEGTGTSGSGHWNNAARSRLYFSAADDDDVRTLQVMKINYADKGEIVKCRWQKGVFVPVPAGTAVERAAATASADDIFMRCLDAAAAQGRNISPNKGITYAPAVFESMAEAADLKGKPTIKRKALTEAMERLMAAGKVKGETFGPPSKPRTRLVRAGADK